MKQRFLTILTLLLCFAFTSVNAQVITAERAAEIANSFFSTGMQKSAAARSVVASPSLTSSFDSNDVIDTASAEPTFHVITNPDGGFVIVSGEETENPIIGYSMDGTIDVNNLPDGFVDYMTDIDAQVKALREYNAENSQKSAAARSAMQRAADYEYNATSMGNIVKNLNTAPWGQSSPFNKLCPVAGTGNAVTGCVPTAYSILCHYYKWPVQGNGTVYNPSTGDPLQLGHTYDYASMRNDSYPSGYTDAEATAVATLMRDMGYAYTATYGSGATTTSSEGPANLIKYFGFKCETPRNDGNYCTKYDLVNNMEQWVTYIKDCLNADYPIPYSSTTALDAQDRHIYILDGYTDNNYFHFNWGWKGQGNGWFTLDNMVPDNTSNYSKSHRAYFNVIPDKTTYTVTATAEPSNMGTVSINGGTAGSTATANLFSGATATLTAHPVQGYALASWTKNDVVVGSRNTIEVTVGTDANDYVANFDDEANVYVTKDYIVNPTTGNLNNGTSKSSTWTYNTSDEYPAELTIKATDSNGSLVTSIANKTSGTSGHILKSSDFIENTSTASTAPTKYTLSVREGYVITGYEITYYPYNGSITVNNEFGHNETATNSSNDYYINVDGKSVQSTWFTIEGNGRMETLSFVVHVKSYNGGGSTPTPDPEPDPTPTTYAVTTTANPVAGGTAKFAVGTGSQQTEGNVNDGESITLYATANTGYHFVNWTLNGNEVSESATCSVTVSQAANYIANFEINTYTVNVSTNGTGGSAMIGTETSTSVEHGASVTLTAQAKDGYHFVNWTLNGNEVSESATCSVTVSQAANYIANFEINTYTVNVSTNGTGGSAMIGTETSTSVEHGASVTLTAQAKDGYHFVNWTLNGNEVSESATCSVTVSQAANYVANFEINTYTVNVSTNGEGGSATASAATAEHGSEVTLTATRKDGYEFAGWYDGETKVSDNESYTFTVTSNINYTARFNEVGGTPTTYTIVVEANIPGTGIAFIKTGTSTDVTGGVYNANSNITLVAVSDKDENGYLFAGWYIDDEFVSSKNEISITLDSDVTYQARFFKGCTINAVRMITADAIQSYITHITLYDGTSLGYDAGNRAVVKEGTKVRINTYVVDGYKVVWKDNDNITISEENDLVVTVNEDVTYFAYFLPDVEVKYYRFGYDFSQAQPAPAARTAATRAVGDVQTLTISFANGSFSDASNDGKRAKIWTSNSSSPTVTLTATSNGIQYRNICNVSNSVSPLNLSLEAYPYNNGGVLTAGDGTTFTIAVDNEDYKITAYSISYNPYSKGYIDGANNNQLAESGLNVSNVSFTVKGTGTSSAVDIQSFTVTIQQVGGGETPEPEPEPETPKHYIQSANENNNPLKMTTDTTAASVFYYDGSKLMSYANGKFVNEYGGKCGLQAYGVENAGIFIVTENDGKATIAVPTTGMPYYLHAAGTSDNYYVSNCSNIATCEDHTNFILKEVTSLPVTISSVGYATFFAPVAVKIAANVNAWYLADGGINGNYASMTQIEGGVIPANTGVILEGAEGIHYFDIIEDYRGETVDSYLAGTVAAEYIKEDAYVLSTNGGGVENIGFYKAKKNETKGGFLNNSHKSYLPASLVGGVGEQGSAGFRLVFGTTAIEEVEAESEVEGIYDLSGRKLEGIYSPGVYIVNGKKVLVK